MIDGMKEVLERTEKTLCDHLVDLNDQVEQVGHIQDPRVLDGFKDCVKTLKNLKELEGCCCGAAKQVTVTAAVAK